MPALIGDKAYWSDTAESEGLNEEQKKIIYGDYRGQPGTPYRDDRFAQLR